MFSLVIPECSSVRLGQALVAPPWALMGRPFMGRPFMGPALMSRALMGLIHMYTNILYSIICIYTHIDIHI